ncbi:hypothetical protein DPMN_119562 [Dreissena polymorpha]|uniref:Uncharacterized protein n=1 Tax=Dreissena polymorpha TaxID=45954 RepID=A0A9D4GJH3_DREPO|nr:hypothetical protein DPMN_119562 [Dreissena polymorpha]
MNKLSAASGNSRRTNERTNERTDGRTEERTNERTDETRDKRTDARMNEGIIISTAQYSQETRSAETSDCRTNNQKQSRGVCEKSISDWLIDKMWAELATGQLTDGRTN